MFKDTKEGTTHYQNDGCGEPAHNNPILKAHLEGVEMFKKQFINPIGLNEEVRIRRNDWWTMKTQPQEVLAFLTTYGTNLLKASVEEIKEHRRHVNIFSAETGNRFVENIASAIDEGIKEIKKGEK